MNKIKNILLSAGVIALFGACSSDNNPINNLKESNQLSFTSNINLDTRAIGTDWSNNDAIGVYALNTGGFEIYKGNSNIEYNTAEGDGLFKVANESDVLELNGKDALDIIAYYPFTNNTTDFKYAIDVKDQTDSEKIDLLYANNVKNLTDNAQPKLEFTHMLSNFRLELTAGADVPSLEGLEVTGLKGTKLDAEFDLKTGTIKIDDNAVAESVNPVVTKDATKATAEALLIPGQNTNAIEITMTLGGQTFIWKGTKDLTLESGKKYIFKGKLQMDESGKLVILNPDSSIQDWEVGHEDNDEEIIAPDTEFAIDVTSLDFEATANSGKVNITAESDQDWTVTTTADWITVTPEAGQGNAEVTIDVVANTTDVARTADVLVKSGNDTLTLTINQKGEATGQLTIIHSENFDAFTSKSQAISVYSKNNVEGKFIEHPNLKYSSEGKANLRDAHDFYSVWLPQASTEKFFIENLNIENVTDLEVSFDLMANAAGQVNANEVLVSVNGVALELLPDEMLDSGSTIEAFTTYTLNIPNTTDKEITVEFKLGPVSQGVRLDNIVFKGIK